MQLSPRISKEILGSPPGAALELGAVEVGRLKTAIALILLGALEPVQRAPALAVEPAAELLPTSSTTRQDQPVPESATVVPEASAEGAEKPALAIQVQPALAGPPIAELVAYLW